MNSESTDAQQATTTQTRRGFIRSLTLASVAAAAAATVVVPTVEAAELPVPRPHPGKVKIFRFRTRDTVACRACKKHHRYAAFRTKKVARRNRAHPGCDCPIEPQWIERKTFRLLFRVNGVKQDVANLKPGRH